MTAPHLSTRSIAAVAMQQIALGLLLFLLLIGWLHIPDANAFEVAASILLALLIAGIAGAGESAIALRLAHRPVTARNLLPGTGCVFVSALLWYGVSLAVDHFSVNDGLRAGYLNSRFPASMRHVFSYEHLGVWFAWMWSALRWIAAGLLAAAAFAWITCEKPMRGLPAVLRSGRYWLSLLLLALVGAVITGTLMTWTPGHGLRVELLSVVLRTVTVVVLYAGAIALLFGAMARAILRGQSAGTGEPEISQPRTADRP